MELDFLANDDLVYETEHQPNEELHFWITKLRKSITKEQLMQVLLESKKLTQKQIELYIRPYISVLADANRKSMDMIREEEPDMGNYFKELFKEDLEKKWNEGKIDDVRNLIKAGITTLAIIKESGLYTPEELEAISAP